MTRENQPPPGPDLSGVLGALGTGIATVDSDWKISYVNGSLAATFGVRGDDCVGCMLWDVFPGMQGRQEQALARATRADGVPRSYRVGYRTGGSTGICDVRMSRGADGTLVLEVHDVSAVARVEREHDRMLESVGEALVVVDREWRITSWNVAAERITLVPRARVLGAVLWERFPALVGSELERVFREAMERQEPRTVRNWYFGGDAAGRGAGVFDMRSYPVEDEGMLLIFSEVTSRVAQELELSARNEENESLRELARALSVETDSAALLRVLAEAARALGNAHGAIVLEVEGEEVAVAATAGVTARKVGARFPLAGSLTERVMRERAAVSEDDFAPALAGQIGGEPQPRVGPALAAPLVAHESFLGALTVTRRAGGTPFSKRDAQRLQVIADYAALVLWKVHLLEEARAASQAKSNFLATISHELRTPLTTLTGYGELLADEIIGPLSAQQHDVIERMRSVTHQLTMMIDEILTYSSIEAGREKVHVTEVRADDLVSATVALVEPLARQKGIAFEVCAPSPTTRLVTDVDKVRQILVNLAGNAVKFTDHGSVRLSVENGAGRVRFSVRDSGIGISPADRALLFQPFSQLDVGLTRRHGGTGLGLYISQRLAELLGGRIELESTVGEGSTFTLTLPVREEGLGRAGRRAGKREGRD